MIESDRAKLYELIGNVYAFYRVDCTQFAYGVWWEACRPFDFTAVAGALNRHAVNPDNGQFLPKPADIVRLIGGTSLDGAQVAWTKVDRAIRSVGPYQTVVFDDPIIHSVIADMGGWMEFGRKDEDAWPFVQREFETRYRGYRTRGDVENVPALTGIFESENGRLGVETEDRVLVGDATKAELVRARITDGQQLPTTRVAANSEARALVERRWGKA